MGNVEVNVTPEKLVASNARLAKYMRGAVVRNQHIAVAGRILINARQAADHSVTKLYTARQYLLANQP